MSEHDRLVEHFAAQLGWRGLQRTSFLLPPELTGDGSPRVRLTYWTTTHPRFFLQFNQLVSGEFDRYNVAVVAEQACIRCTHFEPCTFTTLEQAAAEARRLHDHCARANFRDPKWVRRFLEQHPDRLYPRRKRWRGWKAQIKARGTA